MHLHVWWAVAEATKISRRCRSFTDGSTWSWNLRCVAPITFVAEKMRLKPKVQRTGILFSCFFIQHSVFFIHYSLFHCLLLISHLSKFLAKTQTIPSPRGTSVDEPTGSKVVEIYFNNYSDSIFQHIPQGFRLSFFAVLSGSFFV